jgi:hypothetical protein
MAMPDSIWQTSSQINRAAKSMTNHLKELIEAARRIVFTPEQREQQRRSFAYGNTAFENSRITRDMVDREAEKLASDNRDERR